MENGFSAVDGGRGLPNVSWRRCRTATVLAVFRLLRYMRRSSCESTAQVRVDADASAELERHLRLSVEQALDGRLRSSGFAESLARAETIGRSAASSATERVQEEQEHAAI